MKRCPECRREYDDSMMFCLDDGAELLYGPRSGDEPATAIMHAKSHPNVSAYASSDPGQMAVTKSVAVLPFAHLSSDPADEYFCDGLAEELLNALSRIDGLKVASRTSSFSYKNKDANVGEIGRALGVATVLEGSVRKSANRLRITVQLVNTADGYHLWSNRYDREMQDIFDVQDEIALAVVDALRVKLLGAGRSELLKKATVNSEAFDLYLRARAFWNKRTRAGFESAIKCLER